MFGKLTEEQKARFQAMLQAGGGNAPPPPPPPSGSDNDESDKEVPKGDERSRKEAEEVLMVNSASETVEITNIRLFSIDELDLNSLTQCVSLSLRKNLIHQLSPFPLHLANRLTELDLFDNKIKKLKDSFTSATVPSPTPTEGAQLTKQSFPNPFCSLTKLDLSYNQFKKIEGLDALGPTLKELYLVENKIKEIHGLDALIHLELLELGGNRIREIGDGLRRLVELKQLWLGKNKIKRIGTSLDELRNLELLSLQANDLETVDPECFKEGSHSLLRELYLSENRLQRIENLPIHSLEVLDFSFNPIASINADVINVANLPRLREFWLTDGKIDKWEEVSKLASFSETLRTAYLERNPIEQDKRYRDKVYLHLPFLTQIDSWEVVNKGNLEADRKIERKKETS